MQKTEIPQPAAGVAHTIDEALAFADGIGYPLILRPTDALAGRSVEVVHDREDLTCFISRIVECQPGAPILIEKFLENAIAVEVDAISDGIEAFIPAIMEQIELSGIHSGDSACVLPSVSIPEKQQRTIEEYTTKIATELKVRGLINIQYAIADGKVYLIEASLRASRTVALVSKVCDVPMIRAAIEVMLGRKMSDLRLTHKNIPHRGVKEAVFPFNMFHEVDPILGPEMRSTGEVLGMADTFDLAFYKAQEAAQQLLPQEGTVLMSVSDPDKKETLEIARDFSSLGFKIRATEGTQQYLSQNGVPCEIISKMSAGRPNIVDAIKNGEIRLVINTPIGKRSTSDDSYIRKAAIKHKVPYITTMAAARAAAMGISAFRQKQSDVVSLQKYYAGIQ
jgi:carbamoyl-phosphate synthase large subunit